MDITIDLSQVIAMNTMIADYAVLPSKLLYADQCFVMFVQKDTPEHTITAMRDYCKSQSLFCTVETIDRILYDDSLHTIVRITTWPKNTFRMTA